MCLFDSIVRDAHLLRLGPLVLGQELVLVGELDGAADAVNAVVGLLGREALEGLLDDIGLLLDEVVESAVEEKIGN